MLQGSGNTPNPSLKYFAPIVVVTNIGESSSQAGPALE